MRNVCIRVVVSIKREWPKMGPGPMVTSVSYKRRLPVSSFVIGLTIREIVPDVPIVRIGAYGPLRLPTSIVENVGQQGRGLEHNGPIGMHRTRWATLCPACPFPACPATIHTTPCHKCIQANDLRHVPHIYSGTQNKSLPPNPLPRNDLGRDLLLTPQWTTYS